MRQTRSRTVLTATTLLGLIASCGGAGDPPPDPTPTEDVRARNAGQYLANGSATDLDAYPAAQLVVVDATGTRNISHRWLCSAVAVGERTLLTAAGCVTQLLDYQRIFVDTSGVFVVDYAAMRARIAQHLDADPVTAAWNARAANGAIARIAGAPLQNDRSRDVALLTVAASDAVFASTLPVACAGAAVSERVTIVGFGGDDPTKRWGNNTVDTVDGATGLTEVHTFFTYSSSAQAEPGDVGGPLLVQRAGAPAVAGVISGAPGSYQLLSSYTTTVASVGTPAATDAITAAFRDARNADPTVPEVPCADASQPTASAP